MKSKPKEEYQKNLFKVDLEQLLDPGKPLYQLANKIDWLVFEKEFGSTYSPNRGRPGMPIRKMVALHYLKSAYGESDESVVEKCRENPYWQYFCGEKEFQHDYPCDHSTLGKWRDRIKEKGLECLLKETIRCGLDGKVISRYQLRKVNVDTTVQEKAISYPTDAKLYHKMREKLVKVSRQAGIKLRQSYERKGKESLFLQSRLRHGRKIKKANYHLRKLKTYCGRVLRDVERQIPEEKRTKEVRDLIELGYRVVKQKRKDKNKVYSLHAPEVECLSKGKSHKKYEFGCKASYVTSSRGNFVLGAQALKKGSYDGHTLGGALEQVNELLPSNECVREVYVDRGYRGHKLRDVDVYIPGQRKISNKRSRLRFWLKRRAAIEPIIGHMKNDGGTRRNHLLGQEGDRMQAVLLGVGFNIRKLLKAMDYFLSFIYQLFQRHQGALFQKT